MVKLIKNVLKKLYHATKGLPIIGYFVRIGAAVVRLPDDRQKQLLFETQQLPTLLRSLSEINVRQTTTDAKIENILISVPASLREMKRDIDNTIERLEDTNKKLENTTESTAYLLRRVEFIRRELMFEMRYGASISSEADKQINTKTEILSVEKLAEARNKGTIRLNLGCGHIALDGYLNVDMRALPGVDIVSEVENLPFEENEGIILVKLYYSKNSKEGKKEEGGLRLCMR